jgi:putative peptidoglycan lipid II flippase
MGPAVIAASAVQVNVLVNSSFASYLERGAVSWLSIAFRLMQLPLGIFGVAIGTVTLPLVSRAAALKNTADFRAILARGMRLAFLLTIPSTLGLAALARPIISVIYEHGRFTSQMTAQTAAALQFYAVGLAAYSALKVLTPAFYAIDKRHTPMLVSFLAIGTNLVLNWFFTFHLGWGHRGLALSTSLVAVINFLLLYMMMRKYAGRLETGALLVTFGKLLIAGALMTIFIEFSGAIPLFDRMHSLFPRLGVLLGEIAVSAAIFFGAAALLRVPELNEAMALVRRKLGR